MSDYGDLIEAAKEAAENAYCPYSGYSVGAAILDEHGRVWTGCNIENVSFGATVCAERVALFKMVSTGTRRPAALALWTKDRAVPCGICLQVLSEFANPEMPVICGAPDGVANYLFRELLPLAFTSSEVKRAEPGS